MRIDSAKIVSVLVSILTLLLAACGGGGSGGNGGGDNAQPTAPTISVPPQDTTVVAGQQASFSVTATGTPPLSYQWRKNDVDIPEATSAQYTKPTTTSGDNNAAFSVVVSNSVNSVTSSKAILTVQDKPAPTGQSFVTYAYGGYVYRIQPQQNQSAQNVSTALNPLSAGEDSWLNISKNGAWYVMETTRFGCSGWACLAVVNSDLSTGNSVKLAGNSVIHPDGFSAISNDGKTIVYPSSGSGRIDLYRTTSADGKTWSNPVNITASSPYAYNSQPSFNSAATDVVFDCGDALYAGAGTAICKVKTDGTSSEVVATPQQGPGGTSGNALHHPGFNPDGTITFEADWAGEQIWKKDSSNNLAVVNSTFHNDNSPCVLSTDGRIVSLWLDRPSGTGAHEIKVMDADGGNDFMLLLGTDVEDIGLGCSE